MLGGLIGHVVDRVARRNQGPHLPSGGISEKITRQFGAIIIVRCFRTFFLLSGLKPFVLTISRQRDPLLMTTFPTAWPPTTAVALGRSEASFRHDPPHAYCEEALLDDCSRGC